MNRLPRLDPRYSRAAGRFELTARLRDGRAPRRSPPSNLADALSKPEGTKAHDQSVWLLSYLDVMTILMTFFVLLFAYQKAVTPATKPTKPPVSKVVAATPKAQPSKTPSASASSPKPDAEALAVAAMQTQAAWHALADGPQANIRDAIHSGAGPATVDLTEQALKSAAQLASEQTAQRISQALVQEAEQRQVEVLQEGSRVRLEVSDNILFDPGAAELKSEGLALLDRVIPILSQQTGVVLVEGHTDNRPIANSRFPSNWELSAARATAVTRMLQDRGVPSERLRAVGLADTQPRAGNDTAEDRAKNRRVTLVLDQPRS